MTPTRAWWEPLTRTPRRRALVILAGLLALLGIYLCIITYFLASHLITQYEQRPPGATVTSLHIDYTLLALTDVPAAPSGSAGRTDPPEDNTAYAVAKIRILVHPGADTSYPCSGIKLVDVQGRSWESVYTSSLPAGEDSDYCREIKPDTPTVATIAFAYPDSSLGRVAGVSVNDYTAGPWPVLVPPGD